MKIRFSNINRTLLSETHVLEVVKEWLVAHPLQLPALELGQYFILPLTLKELAQSCLHQYVDAWSLLSLVEKERLRENK